MKIGNKVGIILSSIIGISLIILSVFNMSLNSTWLGYLGGAIFIGFGGFLWAWDSSHTSKTKKK